MHICYYYSGTKYSAKIEHGLRQDLPKLVFSISNACKFKLRQVIYDKKVFACGTEILPVNIRQTEVIRPAPYLHGLADVSVVSRRVSQPSEQAGHPYSEL